MCEIVEQRHLQLRVNKQHSYDKHRSRDYRIVKLSDQLYHKEIVNGFFHQSMSFIFKAEYILIICFHFRLFIKDIHRLNRWQQLTSHSSKIFQLIHFLLIRFSKSFSNSFSFSASCQRKRSSIPVSKLLGYSCIPNFQPFKLYRINFNTLSYI